MFAIAPTASISIICAAGGTTSPGVEPHAANIFTQKTLSGSFVVRNAELEKVIDKHARIRSGIFPEGSEEEFEAMVKSFRDAAWKQITLDEGSVKNLPFLSQDEKDCFKTFMEIDQRWVISHAAARAPFIDQMASNNICLPGDVHKRDLHELHMKAWRDGVPSLYYLRSKSVQRGGKVDHLAGEMPTATPKHEVVLVDRGVSNEINAIQTVEAEPAEPDPRYAECLACA
jgi:ribonucleoside-diphosphate reductase alpha chain